MLEGYRRGACGSVGGAVREGWDVGGVQERCRWEGRSVGEVHMQG